MQILIQQLLQVKEHKKKKGTRVTYDTGSLSPDWTDIV
jgi:hypothetical protein